MSVPRPIRWLLRHFFMRFDRFADLGKVLDAMLNAIDGRIAPQLARFPASPASMPRRAFTSGVPLSKQKFGHVSLSLLRNMWRAGGFYRTPFLTVANEAPLGFYGELEALAHDLGASDLAYVRQVESHEIFAGKALPHLGAIVFTVEMNAQELASAPSANAFDEVSRGYLRLSTIANRLTEFLRGRGYAAYPGTALGGTTDYVALAERAGLGASGFHGLLITPAAGARVRIASLYTNLTNLPERKDDHRWVRDFCAQCRNCVRSCPPGAIYDAPRPRPGGQACIELESCRDYFSANYGCAVCVKVCPFSGAGYESIKAGFLAKQSQPVAATSLPPTPEHAPWRVAVVGAGPAGFFVTQALLARSASVKVDLLERLPTPHGLVRFGVAPDHPEVKSKAWNFERTLDDPRVRLFSNVTFGRDVTRAEIKERYDAVVYATGAAQSRSLGIGGESLPGSLGAAEFVAWYNNHPDAASLAPGLAHQAIAIIGNGNVSLDVARMLSKSVSELASTDISAAALAVLERSKVTEIHLIARRGPAEAAFSPKELRELAEVRGVQVMVDAAAVAGEVPPGATERVRRNLELLSTLAGAPPPQSPVRVRIHFHFNMRPVAILGEQRVRALRCETPAGVCEFEVGLVVRAVGYRSAPLPDVPFDERLGVIPNQGGRVLEAGVPAASEFVSGWVRRGPQGIIGNNKVDAAEVVSRLLEHIEHFSERRAEDDLAMLLQSRGVRFMNASEWRRVQREERRRGSLREKVAQRFGSATEVLDYVRDSR